LELVKGRNESLTFLEASLSQELRKTKQQLLQSEQQKQKLLTSLQVG